MTTQTMNDALIGREIDGYRIDEVLGRGGMGIVYRAEDTALSRTVALKMIDPAMAQDETFLRRFRSEARALARIDSPHIVRIHALRQTEPGLLIVMECVDGGTLADALADGSLPQAEALALFKQMLRAFDDAHRAGVIHRDIKPHNIMLTDDGAVKVTDFGLARLQQRGTQVTATQGMAGTLNYMSPEQVKGRSDLDHRSDLYALGMVLYEMLAGRLPFDDGQSDFARMRAIVEDDVSPPDTYRQDLPAELVQVVMKALQKDPEQRYQSAAEMLEELEESEKRAEQKSKQDAPSADGQRAMRMSLAAGALALILVLGAYLVYTNASSSTSGKEGMLSTVHLSVLTEPDGAAVYVNGSSMGQTPLESLRVESGTLSVLLQKDGYLPVDTTVRTQDGGRLQLDMQLAALDQLGGASPVADRREPAGTAQSNQSNSGGDAAEPAPIPARATLTLSVEPAGTVAVEGRSRSGTGTFEVSAGRHTVHFRHPRYGTEEIPVTLSAGEDRQLTYYFEQTLSVNTTGPWGSISINGESTGQTTPSVFRRGPGTYQVEVDISRDPSYTVTGGAHRLESGGETTATQFTGPVETVVIKPSLEPVRHLLQFRVE